MKRSISLAFLVIILLSVFQNAAFSDSLQLPAQLKNISDQAFYGDKSLTEVIVPDGTASIGERAFAYSGLRRIVIPDSVKKIADNAFEGISGLTVVSSSGSYARQYVLQHTWIAWENSAPPIPITADAPLTRENILLLLDSIDPDGAFIIRNSSDFSLMFWFGSAATIGKGIDRLSTAVHEQCHDYCSTPSGSRYNSIQGKYMSAKEWIYIGNGQHIEVPLTDVFPSSEMVDTIPDSLRTFRFDTYVNGDPITGSIQYGVYGMLDEFTAYCWGNNNDILQNDFKNENHLQSGRYTNSYLAYAEFRYYILHYMLYAKENYPQVYEGIMNNSSFRQAFSTIDKKFAVFAEKQKNYFAIDSWNSLMEEMTKPDYVNMANLLK